MRHGSGLFIVMTLVLGLGGCTRMIWVKPGATQGEFEQIKALCMLDAAKQVPQDNRVALVSEGHSYSSRKCKDNHENNCTDVTNYTPPQYGVVDNNKDMRNQVFRACLYRNGWQEVEQKNDD